jgi:hypothetical protein
MLNADFFGHILMPDAFARDEAAKPARLRQLVQKRVFDPLADFGLVVFRPAGAGEHEPEIGDEGFKVTPLLGRFLKFSTILPQLHRAPDLRLVQ